jgi:hypothetical protein
MKKTHSHVHGRSYFGEATASGLLLWLNSKARPAGDPVERLLELDGQLSEPATFIKRDVVHELNSYLARIVRRSKLAVAPVLLGAAPGRWRIDWRLTGNMHHPQALAIVQLLHLADKGLLRRVRKCAAKECDRWFYARFEHQRFHSERCQQRTFRSDPGWKTLRAEYMKQLRWEGKLREQRWLDASSSKRKGKKR